MFGKSQDYMHATYNTGELSIFHNLMSLYYTKRVFFFLLIVYMFGSSS